MIKSPIQEVTDRLQYRAIGIVNGVYLPNDKNLFNRGFLVDSQGKKIETVILGKALSLIKKHIDLKSSYFWIVYPKNKNTQNLHLQIVGIWDPNQLDNVANGETDKSSSELLEEVGLADNYFSIRGELIYVNTQKKELVIKICSSNNPKKSSNRNFKLVIEGELSLGTLNNFVSLDVVREDETLKMVKYEVIKEFSAKNKK